MLRRGPVLGRSAVSAPLMTPMMMAPTQVGLLGMVQYAGFAKYVRSKPHLNVGTIGRFFSIKNFNALSSVNNHEASLPSTPSSSPSS